MMIIKMEIYKKTHDWSHLSYFCHLPSMLVNSAWAERAKYLFHKSLRATGCVMCRQNLHSTAFSLKASGLVKMSPVPLLKDSRGFSFGLLGLLGHSFVIMTSDLCRPVCWEECRRCLPSVRLMVSRWLLLFQSGMFFWARSSAPILLSFCCKTSVPTWIC